MVVFSVEHLILLHIKLLPYFGGTEIYKWHNQGFQVSMESLQDYFLHFVKTVTPHFSLQISPRVGEGVWLFGLEGHNIDKESKYPLCNLLYLVHKVTHQYLEGWQESVLQYDSAMLFFPYCKKVKIIYSVSKFKGNNRKLELLQF